MIWTPIFEQLHACCKFKDEQITIQVKMPSNPIIKKFMIYYKAEAANISYVQFKVTFFYIILKLNKHIPKYIKVKLALLHLKGGKIDEFTNKTVNLLLKKEYQ